MSRLIVDVDVLIEGKFHRMFTNVPLEVEERSNRKMIEAFKTQHPRLLSQIPMLDSCHRCAFECVPHF